MVMDVLHALGFAAGVVLMFGLGYFIGVATCRRKTSKASESVAAVASGELTKQIAAAEARAREAFEGKSEFGALIERVMKQRDNRWAMFLQHSREHQMAQLMLERALARTRLNLKQAVDIVNAYRKRNDEPELQQPELEGPDDPPFGTAHKFKERMAELQREIETKDPPIDAMAEKAKIEQKYA